MKKVTKKELRKTAMKLLPAIYGSAMRTGAEDGLFQHEDWRTGLCLDAFLLAEAFEKAANYRDAEPKPLLKQLDQSVFDGLGEKWRFAAVDKSGEAWIYTGKPVRESVYWHVLNYVMDHIANSAGTGYDTTNWQDSLIERESKELTGSDLARAMLERGDKFVMCFVSGMSDARADSIPKAITSFNLLTGQFRANHDRWQYAIPINNQGEQLTASEAGL